MDIEPTTTTSPTFEGYLDNLAQLRQEHTNVAGLDVTIPAIAALREEALAQLDQQIMEVTSGLSSRAEQEHASLTAGLEALGTLASTSITGVLRSKIENEIAETKKRLAELGGFLLNQANPKAEDPIAQTKQTVDSAAEDAPSDEQEPLALQEEVFVSEIVTVETAEEAPAIAATEQEALTPLDEYLSPQTAIVLATFLNLIREELKALNHRPLSRQHVDALLESYPQNLEGDDLLTARTKAMANIQAMFDDPALPERIFYELSDDDPRAELFLYLTDLYSRDQQSLHATLTELLITNRQQLITLVQPRRSGPQVGEVVYLPATQFKSGGPETDVAIEVTYTLEPGDASLLARFFYTIQENLADQDLPSLDDHALRAIIAADSLNADQPKLANRLRTLLTHYADPNNILQTVSNMDNDDPRTALLTYLYDLSSGDGAVSHLEYLLAQLEESFLLLEPPRDSDVDLTPTLASPTPDSTPSKKGQPAAEKLARQRIAGFIDRISQHDLNDTYTPAFLQSVLGSRTQKALGSGREHGINFGDGTSVSIENMFYAMLCYDRAPVVKEYARRNRAKLRGIIQDAIASVESKKAEARKTAGL